MPVKQEGTLRAKAGHAFVIEVESNPTTGYQWEAHFPPDAVRLVSREHQLRGHGIGAGGIDRFVFKPKSAGELLIEMSYKRPWETRPVEARTFRVVVT